MVNFVTYTSVQIRTILKRLIVQTKYVTYRIPRTKETTRGVSVAIKSDYLDFRNETDAPSNDANRLGGNGDVVCFKADIRGKTDVVKTRPVS